MRIIREKDELHAAVAALKADGGSIAFVPTMGALHAGHMALVEEARRRASRVVASIFVNPTQFGPGEDLSRYPRREASDARMLEQASVEILWAPDVETMYPDGPAVTVRAGPLGDELDGAARPRHFDGVATVVARLFEQVQPDVALFGEKDYQQLLVIRQMVRDLALPVEIVGVPTQRDADGLALSSRNLYLSDEERRDARSLPRALGEAAAAIAQGAGIADALGKARDALSRAGFDPIDYVELRDAGTLAPHPPPGAPSRILAAAWMGTTRLIDNLPVRAR
ncbi:MAG: pantoate--beta-alanine ligase [Sphingomonadales bacterium]|nr:pantoate--beta-alanine ligase [Sphingomonadales bacterium]